MRRAEGIAWRKRAESKRTRIRSRAFQSTASYYYYYIQNNPVPSENPYRGDRMSCQMTSTVVCLHNTLSHIHANATTKNKYTRNWLRPYMRWIHIECALWVMSEKKMLGCSAHFTFSYKCYFSLSTHTYNFTSSHTAADYCAKALISRLSFFGSYCSNVVIVFFPSIQMARSNPSCSKWASERET